MNDMFKEECNHLENYSNFTLFKDDSPGFSVQRDYPNNISFKPAIDREGNPDSVALIHLVLLEKNEKNDLIPVLLSARKYSRYLANHYDYNFDDPLSPTEASVVRSKKTKQPINLESVNDFFFNPKKKKFQNFFKEDITLKEMLDDIFNEHTKTARKLGGTVLRSKFRLMRTSVGLVKAFINIIKYYLRMANGISFEPGDSLAGELSLYKRENMRSVKTETLDFYGYKASKNSIIFTAIIFITIFLIKPSNGQLERMSYGLKNYQLLSVSTALVVLWFVDYIIPNILFIIINIGLRIKISLLFLKFSTRLWPMYWVARKINFHKITSKLKRSI